MVQPKGEIVPTQLGLGDQPQLGLGDRLLRALLAPILDQLDRLETTMATETETREQLVAAVGGALAHIDTLTADNAALRAALEQADADRAAAVAAEREANDAGDAEFNASQVDRLRVFVAEPTPEPTPEV
jgi:septal ring factor EnvC (AmiA/AmiB activator)